MQAFFSWRSLILLNLTFWAGLILLHLLVRWLAEPLDYTIVGFWPINVFELRQPAWQDLLGFGLIAAFWLGLMRYWRDNWPVSWVMVAGGLLLLMTNLLHGYDAGLVQPITGGSSFSAAYWNDAAKVTSVSHLLQGYTIFQPNLLDHSRVHPPGALLFVYVIKSLFARPEVLALLWGVLGWVSGLVVYKLCLRVAKRPTAILITLLFLILPGVQIYSVATIDAVIMTLFALCIYSWLTYLDQLPEATPAKYLYLALAAATWWLALFLNYAGLLLLPVILVAEWLKRKQWQQSILLIGLVAAGYWLLWSTFDFNYLESLQIAKGFEGPGGSGSHDLPAYVVSRLQAVLELLIFSTPLIIILALGLPLARWRQKGGKYLERLKTLVVSYISPTTKQRQLTTLGLSAGLLMIFVGFLGMGAYYAGETGRAAMYCYPFLMVLAAATLDKVRLAKPAQVRLLTFVFGQTLLMQLFGWYVW